MSSEQWIVKRTLIAHSSKLKPVVFPTKFLGQATAGQPPMASVFRQTDCRSRARFLAGVATVLLVAALSAVSAAVADSPIRDSIDLTQPRIVKVYGAGGFRGMEAYQSGMLISPDGHILTAFSYVLDTDYISVTLDDGRKFDARFVGADPRLEVAVLKVEAEDLPCFDLFQSVDAMVGVRVLAFSNLFGVAMGNEQASVQHGVISVKTQLEARRGAFETPYHGPVYVLDMVSNNPGAAGGALTTRRGQLVGMLGKELRNSLNNTWLNYAIPIDELRQSVEQIRLGSFVAQEQEDPAKPAMGLTPWRLGMILVPDVLQRTPPYVDLVRPGSPAADADVRADDLIVLVDDQLVQSCKALCEKLEYVDVEQAVQITLIRDMQLIDVQLQVSLDELP